MFTPTGTGGHARYTWELCHALAGVLGPDNLTLVTSSDLDPRFRSSAYAIIDRLPAIRHKRHFSSRLAWALDRLLHYPRRDFAFLRILMQMPNRPAIVHLQELTPFYGTVFISLVRLLGCRCVMHVHNVLPHKPLPVLGRRGTRWLMRQAYRGLDAAIVHSTGLASAYRELAGRRCRVHIAAHGVWTSDTLERPRPVADVGFVGVIRPNKGLHLLLDALTLLQPNSLAIAGEVVDTSYIKAQIEPRIERLRALGWSVSFHGKSLSESDFRRAIASVRCMTMPYTDFHAQSGILLDCIAARTPVVVTPAGALAETVREFAIGVVARDLSPAAIAEALASVLGSNQTFSRALEVAAQELTWDRAAEATRRCYQAVESG